MRPFSHKALMHEKIKLKMHKFTLSPLCHQFQLDMVSKVKVLPCVEILPDHTSPQKNLLVSKSINFICMQMSSKGHIPSRLLHPCTSESECKAITCNGCKANVWKKAHPCLLHLCSSELKFRSPHMHKLQPVVDNLYYNLWSVLLAKIL
jgi:hypothetical protein